MNKKTIANIVAIILMVMLAVTLFSTSVFADDVSDPTKTPTTSEGWSKLGTGKGSNTGLVDATESIGATAVNVIRVVGNFIAIGYLIWLGVKWIMASAQDKADLKKNMWAYVIGAILIFGAANILPWIVNFATSFNKTA